MAANSVFARLATSPKSGVLLAEDRALVCAIVQIVCAMRRARIDHAELAARIGRTPAFIRAIVRGRRDITVRELGRIAYTLGHMTRIRLVVPRWYRLAWHNDAADRRAAMRAVSARTGRKVVS